MDPPTGPSQVLSLLLFLHLLLRGGCPHPLGGPSPTSDLSRDGSSNEQEPLDRLLEPQREQMALRQGRSVAQTWKAKKEASAGGLGPPDDVLQDPKRTHTSGCFWRKLDRINSFSGLGCKGLKTH